MTPKAITTTESQVGLVYIDDNPLTSSGAASGSSSGTVIINGGYAP